MNLISALGYGSEMRTPAAFLIAIYGALAIAMTVPAWSAEAPQIVGEASGLDLTGSVWAYWWAAEALQQGANPFMGSHSFFPSGVEPLFQYNLLDAVIHAPLTGLLGPRLGYNFACIFVLMSTGWSAHRLGIVAGSTRMGALLTGVLVQTSSFVALELHCGRISQAMLVFFLLALGNTIRLVRGERSSRFAVVTGVLAAATALVYWYYGAALLISAGLIIWLRRSEVCRGTIRALGIAAVTGLALTLPFVFELLAGWSQLPGIERPDAAGIVAANSRGVLWPVLNSDPVFGHQLSIVAVLLAGLAIGSRRPGWGSWVGVAVVGWALALGPGDSVLLPFDWLQKLVPGMDRMWWPYRFEVLAVVGVAVLAGLGLDHWVANRGGRGRLWLAAAILACTLDAPLRSGLLPLTASTLPEGTVSLYSDVSGPLLTVPLNPAPAEAERLLLVQTMHGQPIPVGDGAHIQSHVSTEHSAWLSDSALLRSLTTLQTRGTVSATIQPEDVARLIDDGFTHAVVDPAVFDSARAVVVGAAYSELFRSIWGDPVRTTRAGGTWQLLPLTEPVQINVSLRRGSERVRGRRR